eukprot:maker-scaffold_27-snap-gene-3.5-mRNA-1 protein AED:0.01 eAED:0.01 QI:204/1/1/1/1/1/2/231/452
MPDEKKIDEVTESLKGASISETIESNNPKEKTKRSKGFGGSKIDPEMLQQIMQAQAAAAKKAKGKHRFWSTQPMLQSETDAQTTEYIGPLDEQKTVDQVRQEPYPLPAGFNWCSVDLEEEKNLKEIYDLLTSNYVEDDDNLFRFDYSVAFIKWALCPPGGNKDWIVGVRDDNENLLALITGIPAKTYVYDQVKHMAEINFLCVHKGLRSKRLAPVLIKEITRRVNLTDKWQAVYTAGVVLPTPVAKCRYYHRSINPQKLIEVGFSALGPRMTMQRTIRLYKLPEETRIPGFRKMTRKDVPVVSWLLKQYLSKFKVWIEFTQKEVGHWLMPKKDVVSSFVVETIVDGKPVIKDFCSYYHIPNTVIGHEKHKKINAVYSFYNVATTVSWTELMRDALVMAAKEGCDVFNCLDLMDNKSFIEDLKFGKGDGNLNYYLYNFACPTIKSEEMGVVLL